VDEVDALIAQINRRAKEEIVVRGARLRQVTFQRCTTGSLVFDLMLGGGWPLNCWNEIIGPESSGKTALTIKTIAAAQQADPKHHTAWVASEDFYPEWAELLGINMDQMTFITTNVMELAYDAVLELMTERAVDAIVIDSYPALVPSEEGDKSMLEMTVGRGAYLTNKFMRKSYAAMRRSLIDDDRPCLGLFINQWRDRIGVFGYGDPRITPGGKGKNYSFLTRVDVSREEWLTTGSKVKVGQAIKCRTLKNKTAPPQRTGTVDFYFDDGGPAPKGQYDTIKQATVVALEADIIERKGAWYSFGVHKWQGEKAVVAAMQSDPLLVAAIAQEVRHFLLGEPLSVVDEPPKRRVIKKA
jgi:recombination protein RecA